MDFPKEKTLFLLLLLTFPSVSKQQATCPSPESILPCICTHRQEDAQIWCTHSDLMQVVKGIQKIGEFIRKPIDEIIIENNYLPSLPGKLFQSVKILRLMLRHNGLERVSAAWLESQETNLLEIFIVENELKSIPSESLMKLQNLQALTIQSQNLKRIPPLMNMPKLRYVHIQSESLNSIQEHTFQNLPSLERLFIRGSLTLQTLKENAFFNLPKLRKLDITNCGINIIHMRALSLLPELKEFSLSNNRISDAGMVGRATRDLPMLSILNLNHNIISKLNEGAFVDQPMLETLFLSNNNINIIHHGAFHRVPKLRVVDLNHNEIIRIHPESFLQQSGSGVEELSLIGNKIMHISEFRALLDALPRLRYLDMSSNLLREIPRGALRGHPSLERLHLNKNSIKVIDADAFVAMPALRELHLRNNSLNDMNEGPFWNLPALKGLDLSQNYFRRLQPKLLYNLPALRRFDLSNNQLSIIDPISFMETPLLEHVNISGNSLVSIHPATFRNLPSLYELDASSNRLVEFVPGLPRGLEQLYLQRNQITNLPASPSPDIDLPSLRTLDISNNGIQKIPHSGMKTLHNLRRLYMKRNGLRQIEVATFSDLERLEILDVSDNQIMTVHPKCFSKLGNLKEVNLRGNNIENFEFIAIQNNGALSAIDFSKNKLKSISPNLVNRGLDVEILNISSNNLHELPNTLNMLSKLKVLDASHNHLKHFDGNIINNIQTLAEIKMHSNKIIELRTGSFKDLKNLETIDFENNQLEMIHPMAIASLPRLLSIYLSRNHIVDIPDRTFSNLPKLKIIEMQGNPLVCNCAIIWLKAWLSESSSLGPKCADGTYVKGMPFSKSDCMNIPIHVSDMKSCVTFENEALLPNLQTSQVFSSLDKIKDYETHIKNNYHGNKLSNRPLPEESDYFYDEYVDYPYNETILENMNGNMNQTDKSKNRISSNISNTPIKNTTNTKTGIALKVPVPSSGFTFFGVPLPSIDMGKLLNTDRKIDWSDNRNNQHMKKYQETEPPRFETGGFSPMLPVASDGFMPIANPTISHTMIGNEVSLANSKTGSVGQSVLAVDNIPPKRTVHNNATHKKTKSEIHELEAYRGDDNTTHIAYNRTKNIEEQNSDPIHLRKYNLMESNMTITQATDKEGIITTDTSNDMSLHGWLETTSILPSSPSVTSKPPIKKHVENQSSQSQPTALSAILLPTNEDVAKNHSRTATITKVNMPHAEHYDLRNNYAPVINREAKTRFSETIETGNTNTNTKRTDDHEWYYKNYNKTNLDPYVAPGIHTSSTCKIISNYNTQVPIVLIYLMLLIF